MNRARRDLPIILSHSTHTGIISLKNGNMGGRDLLIVGLNKEIPSGGAFELADIDWVKGILHFADIESLQVTAECLMQEFHRWRNELNEV